MSRRSNTYELARGIVVSFGAFSSDGSSDLWGTGEWMETWKENAEGAGVNVVDTVIANLEPDDDAIETLKALGEKLSE